MGDYAFFEATRIFKRAVPLMVKYKVPTTPHYFSLWYTYCAQTHPALNEAVDEKVERYGMCSTSHCDSLIETFLLDDTKKEMDSFRQKLESLATDLGHSMEHHGNGHQRVSGYFKLVSQQARNRQQQHHDIHGE